MTDRLDDLVEGMRCDLSDINTGIRWAWAAGYGKAGRGLDAVHGASLARSEAEVDRGPTYDLGIGDHACRVATQRVGRFLGDAEHVLARARIFAGWRDWPRFSAEYVTPGTVRHLDNLVLSVRLCARLVDDVEASYPSANDLGRRRTLKEMLKASQYLRHAVGGLDRALLKGKISQPSEPKCGNPHGCHELASSHEREVRCDACARWKRRHEGNTERPKHLLRTEEVSTEPRRNQNKRKANGLDWGSEDLSHAWRIRR